MWRGREAWRPVVAAVIAAVFGWPSGAPAAPALKDYLIVSNREGDVQRYDLGTGKFAGTVAKRGENGLNVPFGMTLGPDGVLYVASTATEVHGYPPGAMGAIHKYDPADGRYLGVFATLPNPKSTFWDITFGPDGHLYTVVQDAGTSSAFQRYDGKTGSLLATLSTVSAGGDMPGGQSVGPDGNLYVNFRSQQIPLGVRVFDGTSGALLREVRLPQTSFTRFNAFGPDGLFYVSDYFSGNIDVYDFRSGAAGDFVRTIPNAPGAQGMVFDGDGVLYAGAYYGNAIAKVLPGSGQATLSRLEGLRGPIDVVIVSTPIPEPGTWAFMLAGLAALGALARRRPRCRGSELGVDLLP
jgi:sugar lactone lactonase YvrE